MNIAQNFSVIYQTIHCFLNLI